MWLKLSDDFGKDCRRAHLSDAAFRLHVEMLCFVMDDENGGFVNGDDILATSRATRPFEALQELIRCGFWTELASERWQITHQMNHQPDAEVLDRRRQMDAERQRKKRRQAVGLKEPAPNGGSLSRRDSTRDTPSDDPRDPGRGGTGLDGTGRALEVKGSAVGEAVDPWDLPEPEPSPPGDVDLLTGEIDECSDCTEPLSWCKCPSVFRGNDPS